MKDEITEQQKGEAFQKIREFYDTINMNFNAIDWENPPSWWPPEIKEANETIKNFYAQFPDDRLL